MIDRHSLTPEELALRKREIQDEAQDRATLGEPLGAWVTIVWRGKADGGRPFPALGPCRPPTAEPEYLGQRRYSLFDVINGEFRL